MFVIIIIIIPAVDGVGGEHPGLGGQARGQRQPGHQVRRHHQDHDLQSGHRVRGLTGQCVCVCVCVLIISFREKSERESKYCSLTYTFRKVSYIPSPLTHTPKPLSLAETLTQHRAPGFSGRQAYPPLSPR